MNFAAIVSRFAPPPPSVATIATAAGQSTIKLAITQNWKGAMSVIQTKLDDAHAKRTQLVEARRALLLAAVEGDDASTAKLSKVERDLADTDRDIARLRDGLELARERDDAEKAVEDAAERQRALALYRTGCDTYLEKSRASQAAAQKFAATILAQAAAADELRAIVPSNNILPRAPGDWRLGGPDVHTAARRVLRAAGLNWAWHTAEWPQPPTMEESAQEQIAWATAHITEKQES